MNRQKIARSYPNAEEIKIRGNAAISQLKKEFLHESVSYLPAKELPFLVAKIKQTDGTRKLVRNLLDKELNAVFVSVGSGMVAVVKRPANKPPLSI